MNSILKHIYRVHKDRTPPVLMNSSQRWSSGASRQEVSWVVTLLTRKPGAGSPIVIRSAVIAHVRLHVCAVCVTGKIGILEVQALLALFTACVCRL